MFVSRSKVGAISPIVHETAPHTSGSTSQHAARGRFEENPPAHG